MGGVDLAERHKILVAQTQYERTGRKGKRRRGLLALIIRVTAWSRTRAAWYAGSMRSKVLVAAFAPRRIMHGVTRTRGIGRLRITYGRIGEW